MVSVHLGELVKANFKERLNRFLCTVECNGSTTTVHLHDPGRLTELLIPDIPVLIREEKAPHRKTDYDMVAVKKDGIWVSCDSRIPNKLVKKALEEHILQLPEYKTIIPEYTYKESRLDFCLDNTILIEVKGVTLVRDRVALFPDAPTKRGKRHVETLISALHDGFSSYVLFLVQRPDAYKFLPNAETDPDFANTLQKASKKGVNIRVYTAEIVIPYMYLRKKIL